MTSSDPQTDWFQSRFKKNLVGVALVMLTTIAFFSPMLFDGKVIFYRDFNVITYPIRYFLGQVLNQGAIPYWISHANAGMPFMASFHPGVFYPPSVLFFLDDTTYALNLFYVLHFVILGVFTFLLARSWGISFIASLCCSVTAMLSGFMLAATLLSNLFLSAVWLPMVFWFFHQYWMRRHIGYFIGLVVTIATQTLAACPENNIMTMLLLYAHSIYFLPRTPGVSGVARLTASLGLAVILALGLCALQLFPTAQLIKHSFRDGGLSYEGHTVWSMEPRKLLTLFMPRDYRNYLDNTTPSKPIADSHSSTETSLDSTSVTGPESAEPQQNDSLQINGFLQTIYMGFISLVFIFLSFIFHREKSVKFWLVIFLFGILLALGKYNPLYSWIYWGVPFLNLFRYPEKYFFVSSFAAVFLTGYGLDALIRYTCQKKIRVFRVLTILMVVFGIISFLMVWKAYPGTKYTLPLFMLFGFVFILFYFRKMKASWFAASVLMVICVDLSVTGIHLLPLIDRKYYEERPLILDAMEDSQGEYRVYSGRLETKPNPYEYPAAPSRMAGIIAGKEHLYPYFGMVFGFEHVNGWPGLALELKNNMLWRAVFEKSLPERRKRILARSNTKYWVDGDKPNAYKDGFPLVLPDRLKILKNVLPRAYLVPKMKVLGEDDEHPLNIYYDKAFDPRTEVLLNQEVDFHESARFHGKVEQVAYRPNHVTVTTQQEGNGFLVLVDSYFPGWTVTVDGQKQPILRANYFYRAVQLGPGRHTLEFEYFPEGLKTGLVVSGISLSIIILIGLFWQKIKFKLV